jgi:death-on-curing protein
MRVNEPLWISRLVVEAIHADQVREHGGLAGMRDEGALESALARPQQRWHDQPASSLAGLAAAYGFGLAQDHPFRDGNKRTAFLVMATFLGLNGLDLDATDAEVVEIMLAVAAGRCPEPALEAWVDAHVSPGA